jgi:uncharacterized protein
MYQLIVPAPVLRVMLLALLLLTGLPALAEDSAKTQEKVYYEVASHAAADTVLAGVEDHLAASGGKASIVVIVYGKCVDFLREGARNPAGKPYSATIQELSKRGVEFRVCGTTLKRREIDPQRVIPEGQIVPGGGAELKRLREQGYKRLN